MECPRTPGRRHCTSDVAGVLELRGLADPGLAPDHERPAPAHPSAIEQMLEQCALALAGDQHLSTVTGRAGWDDGPER